MKSLARKNGILKRWWQDKARSGLLDFQRCLFLPLSILPLAGLFTASGHGLLQLGFIWADFLIVTGETVFSYWTLLLAVSLAYNLNREKQGIAAFSAVITYGLLAASAGQINIVLADQTGYQYTLDTGWVIGLCAGLVPLLIWRLAFRIRLPQFLAFFSGGRLIPIISSAAALIIGPLIGLIWHYLSVIVYQMVYVLPELGSGGSFLYAALSRLLQPVGLNRVLEQFILHENGSFISLSGQLFTGDKNRFLAGDMTAGFYTAGSFPVLIFAVPAAAVLFLLLQRGQRKFWSGLVILAALPSVIGGIAVPFEYMLLVFSPLLFFVYTLLHGVSAVLAWSLQVRHGFSLAPGLVDYIDHWSLASNPHYLIFIGLLLAVLIFALFYFLVMRLGIAIPGRLSPRMSSGRNSVRPLSEDLFLEPADTVSDDSDKVN